MSKTEAIMKFAFHSGLRDRSAAYRSGVWDALLKRLDGVQDIQPPYPVRSAEADAYLLGMNEGTRLADELTLATPQDTPVLPPNGGPRRFPQERIEEIRQMRAESRRARLQDLDPPGLRPEIDG